MKGNWLEMSRRRKKNTIVLMLLTFFVISGCDSHICCTNIDTGFYLSFVDQNGDDLLDPNHPNAITEQNTDLYYLIDGEMVKQFEGHLDHPKMFSIIAEEKLFERHYMIVFPNTVEGDVSAITYLEFGDNSMDTIKTQYNRQGGNSIYTSKIWYNGELRFDVKDESLQEYPNNEYVDKYITVTRSVE